MNFELSSAVRRHRSSPSPREARTGRGLGRGVSELGQQASSPRPSPPWVGGEGEVTAGSLRSEPNSTAVLPVPLPTRASRGEGENFWWLMMSRCAHPISKADALAPDFNIRSFELRHSFDIRPPSAVLPPRPSPIAPVPLRKAGTPSAALLRRTGHSDFVIVESLLTSAATEL